MAKGRPYVAILLVLLASSPLALLPAHAEGSVACGTVMATGCEAWTVLYSNGEISSSKVAVSPDGTRVLVVALDLLYGGPARPSRFAITSHHAGTGEVLWNTTYDEHPSAAFRMVRVSPDGERLYIVGTAAEGFTTEGYLLTIDALNGNVLWKARLALDSEGAAITLSPEGARLYLTGMLRRNYVTAAFDAVTGLKLWESYYDNNGGKDARSGVRSLDHAHAVAVSPDGAGVFVTGMSGAADGLREYATLAYDAATGAQRWVRRVHGTDLLGNPVQSGGFNLAVSPAGDRVYAFGTDGIKAYDAATGTDLWTHRTEGAACRLFWSPSFTGECNLKISPSGDRLYAGTHNNVAAYDTATGELVWRLPIHLGDDNAMGSISLGNDMALRPDGTRLYLVGRGGKDHHVTDHFPSISDVYETTALDTADGALRWRVTYNRGWDQVSAIDVSPDGSRVFVTGHSSIQDPADLVTLAYDTNLGLDNLPPLT